MYSLNLADFRTINLMMKFYVGLWDLIWPKEKREEKMFIFRQKFVLENFGRKLENGAKFGCWARVMAFILMHQVTDASGEW